MLPFIISFVIFPKLKYFFVVLVMIPKLHIDSDTFTTDVFRLLRQGSVKDQSKPYTTKQKQLAS